jgi:LemA protein
MMEEPKQQTQQQPVQRQQLADDGYSEAESDKIFERAAQLHSETIFRDEPAEVSEADLEKSAERAGIPGEFVEEAIRQLNAERVEQEAREKQEAAQCAMRQRKAIMAGVVAGALLLITALFSHGALNSRLAAVEEKRAQLENVLQRRHDLIPTLSKLATSLGPRQERKAVTALDELNKESSQAASLEVKLELEARLSIAVKETIATLRDDPGGTSTMFFRLSDEIAGAENRIAMERKRYNEAVAAYNRTARSFPVLLVRPLLGFPAQQPYFQASGGAGTGQ